MIKIRTIIELFYHDQFIYLLLRLNLLTPTQYNLMN